MTKTIVECRFCGQSHGVLCPSVKSIEYFEDGATVKRVEFKCASDFYAPLTTIPAAPYPWPAQPLPVTWGNSNTHGPAYPATASAGQI